VLSAIGIVYASCIALVQKDFKRLIAYSSIAHVGMMSAGIFTLTTQGLEGSIIQMISHGINIVALFFIAEIISTRTNTLDMDSLGGIRLQAPQFATCFIIILLGSIALPFTNGFVGEFLLLNGLFQYNAWIAGFAGLSVILGAVYSLRAFQKIALGNSSGSLIFPDLNLREKCVLIPLIILIFWIGIFPQTILNLAKPSVETIRNLVVHLD